MKLTKKLSQRAFLVLTCLGIFLFSASLVLSQTEPGFYFKTTNKSPAVNESFLVQIFVWVPESEVNTVHLEISYPETKLKLEDLSFSDSSFPNIIERNTDAPGLIKLTAFTIQPYQGDSGLVTTIKFKALAAGGSDLIILPESSIHLADGRGTNIFNLQESQVNSLDSIEVALISNPTPEQNSTNPYPTQSQAVEESQYSTLEEQYFPEEGVEDYTQKPETKISKITRQVEELKEEEPQMAKVILAFIVLAIITSLVLVFLLVKRKKL